MRVHARCSCTTTSIATRDKYGSSSNLSEFSFTAAVRGYRRVWLPHVGQRLSAERDVEDRSAIAVREDGGSRADEVRPLTLSQARALIGTTHDLIEWAWALFGTISKWSTARRLVERLAKTLYIFVVAWIYANAVPSKKAIPPSL